jgi:hypothetical protein
MLDFIFSYEFNQRPQMELADAQAPLPCSVEIGDNCTSPEMGLSRDCMYSKGIYRYGGKANPYR